MFGITTKVDMDNVEKKLSKNNTDKGQYAMANQMLADMNMYVPYQENPLRTSGHVSTDSEWLIWNTPYARAQFFGTNGRVVFRRYTTPGTGKRWDLAAKANHMDSWQRMWVKGAGF